MSAGGYSAREVKEGVEGLIDPDNLRRAIRELEDLAEALAKAALAPVELVRGIMRQIHGIPAALLIGYVIVKSTEKGSGNGRRPRNR